jgi:hypothetical protein
MTVITKNTIFRDTRAEDRTPARRFPTIALADIIEKKMPLNVPRAELGGRSFFASWDSARRARRKG